MERTVLINPRHEAFGEEKVIAYEGCFSVEKVTGQVARYKTISYSAWSLEGIEIKGTAHGFLARVLQHEIDHLKGQCFLDHVEGKLLSMKNYIKMRQEKMDKDK